MRQEKLAKVAKVIGLSKLRSKYESHEAKRNLCAQYDMFLADDRIIPLLPKLIGGLSGRRASLCLMGADFDGRPVMMDWAVCTPCLFKQSQGIADR